MSFNKLSWSGINCEKYTSYVRRKMALCIYLCFWYCPGCSALLFLLPRYNAAKCFVDIIVYGGIF